MPSTLTLALAGNPNSGKTTMFNALTGARQHVGNYPGVTVAKKEGRLHVNGRDLLVVDLPGTYSLTPYSDEELAARNFLLHQRPHAVVDILDANTLERSLYLAVQLLELGAPLVLALNMMDEVRRRKVRIDSALLSRLLGVPVVETVARDGQGKDVLVREAVAFAEAVQGGVTPLRISYGPDVDAALEEMTPAIMRSGLLADCAPARWVALKVLEGDPDLRQRVRDVPDLAEVLEPVAARVAEHLRRTEEATPEAVIANYRYGFIASLMRQGVLQQDTTVERIRRSDQIDRVVTHPLLGPILMLAVLYGMFQLTFVVGEVPMGWLEDFFGWLSGAAEAAIPEGPLQSLVVSGVIDGVGGVLGFVPLILVMFLCLSFLEDLGYMARLAYMLDRVFRAFGLHGSSVMPFIISGGIPGGCAVPGVMAARTLRSPREKLATILTAPFMSCGAKVPVFILLVAAFFPEHGGNALFLITLGAWTATLLVAKLLRLTAIKGPATPFLMELPPYRLPTLRGLLIHTWERGWQYIKKAGTVILAISILLWAAMTYPGLPEDQTAAFEARRAAIAAEIDALPAPAALEGVAAAPAGQESEAAVAETAPGEESAAADAAEDPVRAALEERLADLDNQEAEAALRNSLAGRLGVALEGVSSLAGFDWRVNIALVGGFAAKEVIVSTLGTAYSLGDVDPEESEGLSGRLAADPAFSVWTALSLIVFTILYAPCFVTVVCIARETSWKWAAFSMAFNTTLAFTAATAVYQIGVRL